MENQVTIKQRKNAKKPLLWVSQASMFMAFAGLTSGYVVSKGSLQDKGLWMEYALPQAFSVSTALILCSSLTIILAGFFLKKSKKQTAGFFMLSTLFLGVGFTLSQLVGWNDLVSRGIFFTGPGSNASGSWIYAITFLHLVHLAAGLISLIVSSVKTFLGKYTADNRLGFELTAIFWHFLGAIWVYLYVFLLIVR